MSLLVLASLLSLPAFAGPEVAVRGVVPPERVLAGVTRVTFGAASGPEASRVMSDFRASLLDAARGSKEGFTPADGLRVDVLQSVQGGEADAVLDLAITAGEPVETSYTDPVTKVVSGVKVEIVRSCRKREMGVEARLSARRTDGVVIAEETVQNVATATLCKDTLAELQAAIAGGVLPGAEALRATAAEPVGLALANKIAPSWATWTVELAVDKLVRDGNKLARDGDWGGAVAAWTGILEADPYNPAAAFNLAVAAEVAGDFASARAAFDKVAALRPGGDVDRARARVTAREAAVQTLVDTWALPFQPVVWAAPAAAAGPTVAVKGGKNARVPLQAEPSGTASVVAQLPGGVSVRLLGEAGDWVQVEAPDGVRGYLPRAQVSGL